MFTETEFLRVQRCPLRTVDPSSRWLFVAPPTDAAAPRNFPVWARYRPTVARHTPAHGRTASNTAPRSQRYADRRATYVPIWKGVIVRGTTMIIVAVVATAMFLSLGVYTGNQLWSASGLLILLGIVAWAGDRHSYGRSG